MLKFPKISIITPTYQRHAWLISCIEQVKNQDVQDLCEHIVVSDGLDDQVVKICKHYNIRYKCIDKEQNNGTSKGHKARDVGIEMANGEYIVLWDDDNIYYRTALSTFLKQVKDYDMIVCNINYRVRRQEQYLYYTMPKNWVGSFVKSDIDTMNVMLKSNLAKKAKWTESDDYAGDFYWFKKLEQLGASIGFSDVFVGIKN